MNKKRRGLEGKCLRAILLAATVLVVATSCVSHSQPSAVDVVEESMSCPHVEGWASIPVRYQGPGIPDGALMGSGTILANGPNGDLWEYAIPDPAEDKLVSQRQYRRFRPSPAATMVAGVVQNELWLLNLETGAEKSLGIPASSVLAWRPDGLAIFFVGSAESGYGIGEVNLQDLHIHWWARAVSDLLLPDPREGAVQVVEGLFDIPHASGSLSADGTSLVLSAGHSGTMSVFVLDLLDGRLRVYPQTGGDGFSPKWHPDLPYVVFGYGNLRLLHTETGEVMNSGIPVQGTVADLRDGKALVAIASGDSDCWLIGNAPPLGVKR